MGQVERAIPSIYVALEDRQEDHQSTVVEVVGNIVEKFVSILTLVLLIVKLPLE